MAYQIVTGVLRFEPNGFVLTDQNGTKWSLDIEWDVNSHIGRVVAARGYNARENHLEVTELINAD